MTADLVWPGRLLTPADAKLSPVAYNTSGGTSFDGSEQVIGNTPGRWKLEIAGVHLFKDAKGDRVKCWHAIEAILQGRAGVVSMPVFDYPRAPWPLDSNGKPITDRFTDFDDGQFFDDGSEFVQTLIIAYLTATVAAGAVTASIQMQSGAALQGGEVFACAPDGKQRCYRVTKINSITSLNGFPVYNVGFTLPARVAIPSGTQIFFDDPLLDCRLEKDDAMHIKGGHKLWRQSSPELTLWENV